MTKLVMETKSGYRFFVMKEARRKSDPTRDDIERAMVRSRRYTPNALVSLQTVGALFEFYITGRRFAFVRTDAPTILGGRSDGFWKVFQRRYGYKHAVHGSDRVREPRLWADLVDYFSKNVEEGSIASSNKQNAALPRIPKPVAPVQNSPSALGSSQMMESFFSPSPSHVRLLSTDPLRRSAFLPLAAPGHSPPIAPPIASSVQSVNVSPSVMDPLPVMFLTPDVSHLTLNACPSLSFTLSTFAGLSPQTL